MAPEKSLTMFKEPIIYRCTELYAFTSRCLILFL